MSRNTKIILAIVAGILVLLCLCVGGIALATSLFFINTSVTTSADSIRTVVEEAVQVGPGQLDGKTTAVPAFDLPEGWRSDYAMTIAGFKLVGYRPESGTGHIMLAVLPEIAHADIEKLEAEVRAMSSSHGYRWNNREMKVVERRPATINGQETEMVIAEGTGSGGPWRQAMVSVRGDRGLTLVIYGMPQATYDQAEADALFASIR